MTDATIHKGSCHCGKVRFEVEAEISSGMTCNCSICQRKGTVLTFVPESKFRLLSGEGEQTEYKFNKQIIQHLFCKTCGVESFARAVDPRTNTPTVAVNIRCLEDVDVEKIPTKQFNGRAM